MESVMKLSSGLLEQTLSQYDAQVIPDDHPVAPQLSRLFGDHTFFLDREGLSIVEPVEAVPPGSDSCKVVKLANWAEGGNTLTPHEPEETDVVIKLDAHR
jgi:hypothetical protein